MSMPMALVLMALLPRVAVLVQNARIGQRQAKRRQVQGAAGARGAGAGAADGGGHGDGRPGRWRRRQRALRPAAGRPARPRPPARARASRRARSRGGALQRRQHLGDRSRRPSTACCGRSRTCGCACGRCRACRSGGRSRAAGCGRTSRWRRSRSAGRGDPAPRRGRCARAGRSPGTPRRSGSLRSARRSPAPSVSRGLTITWNGTGLRSILGRLADVFDDGQLQRQPDLRRRQPDAGRVPHGFAHQLDETLNLRVRNLGGG